jgi:hypothetical protein
MARPFLKGGQGVKRKVHQGEGFILISNQLVAQAFQPVIAQAKACGYRKYPLGYHSVSSGF